jgi:small subunit ribosomal protein S16
MKGLTLPANMTKMGLAKGLAQVYCFPPFGAPCRRRAVELNRWLAAATGRFYTMAVRIRMKRVGTTNAPYFRIVVADSRSPRDGKFIEEIGTYQPRKKGENYKMDLERAKYWISKGAQPSETVASFLKKLGKAAAPS